MTIKITWHSHACFLIETRQTRLLTDPFLNDNPLASGKADEIQTDYILVSHGHGDHVGDTVSIYPWGRVKLTIAHHGSALPDGSYGGNPCGFLFYIEGKKIYHACDTGLFYDMKLIGEEGIDLAILPIGDNFTMGPDDALRAVKLIEPAQVVPIHYNTFDVIKQDPNAWAAQVQKETAAKATVMNPGESLEL
jgi:L-ascorbate metabolism protein UlaG (beta-lactamase superfamily)